MQGLPDPNQLLVGALAFLRIGGILFALPVIGDSPTPVRARMLLSLALTVGLYPLIPPTWAPSLSVDALQLAAYVAKELMIGLVVGFVARIAFDGVLMAANVVSYQMGFGTANMFMPDFSSQLDAFSAFHRMIIMLIFLTLGLHHVFIAAIVDTFRLIPGGAAELHGSLGPLLVETTGGIITIGIQLAAPILVALLFTMAALGLIARTVPNMNVFVMSFPISFFIGMIVYVATLPFYPAWLHDNFLNTQEQIFGVIRALAQ